MIGLIALALLGAWIWLAFKLSKIAADVLTGGRWRWPVAALVFSFLLLLPLLDEIVSYRSFAALCKEKVAVKVDEEKIRGRSVRHSFKQHYIRAGVLRVLQSDSTYVDHQSGEVLATSTWLRARGGWLSRALTEGQNPITFVDDYECKPKLDKRLEETYQFNLIEN
jgi:hypothetical protein